MKHKNQVQTILFHFIIRKLLNSVCIKKNPFNCVYVDQVQDYKSILINYKLYYYDAAILYYTKTNYFWLSSSTPLSYLWEREHFSSSTHIQTSTNTFKWICMGGIMYTYTYSYVHTLKYELSFCDLRISDFLIKRYS